MVPPPYEEVSMLMVLNIGSRQTGVETFQPSPDLGLGSILQLHVVATAAMASGDALRKEKAEVTRVSVFPETVTPLCDHLVVAAFSFLKMQIMSSLYLFIWVCVIHIDIVDPTGKIGASPVAQW